MTMMTMMTTMILRDDVVSSGSFGWCSRPREWVAADLVAFGPALAPSLSRRHRPRGKESPSPGKRKKREKTSSLKQKSKKRESSSRRRFVFSFFSLFSFLFFSFCIFVFLYFFENIEKLIWQPDPHPSSTSI